VITDTEPARSATRRMAGGHGGSSARAGAAGGHVRPPARVGTAGGRAGSPPRASTARPARRPRPDQPRGPFRPASPVRPVSPVRPAGPGRPGRPARTGTRGLTSVAKSGGGQAHARESHGRAGRAARSARSSFVLLVLGLLAGSLVGLLVVNTTLAANSMIISNLQQANSLRSQRVQELSREIAAATSAPAIAREARLLGMRPDAVMRVIDLGRRSIMKVGAPSPAGASKPGRPRGAR
jgi:hypothetical protein